MKGFLCLIAGGEIRTGETKEVDDRLRAAVPKGANFVFFGTAANDNSDYINSIKAVFGNHFRVVVPTEKDGPEFAHAAIRNASVIYLGGGATDVLLDLFEKWKLVESLRSALNCGTHIIGMSAGAQALSQWYIHEDGEFMELRRGWGFLSVCVLVHARPDSVARAKTLWEENSDIHANSFISIKEGEAWCVSPAGTYTIGSRD